MNNKGYTLFSPKRITGIVLLCLSLFGIFALFTDSIVPIKNIMLGIFGFMSYPIVLFLAIFGVLFIFERFQINYPLIAIFLVIALYTLICVFSILFSYSSVDLTQNYFAHLANVYKSKNTVAGLLTAITTYPLMQLTDKVSAIIIFVILFIISIFISLRMSVTEHFKSIRTGDDVFEDISISDSEKSYIRDSGKSYLNEIFSSVSEQGRAPKQIEAVNVEKAKPQNRVSSTHKYDKWNEILNRQNEFSMSMLEQKRNEEGSKITEEDRQSIIEPEKYEVKKEQQPIQTNNFLSSLKAIEDNSTKETAHAEEVREELFREMNTNKMNEMFINDSDVVKNIENEISGFTRSKGSVRLDESVAYSAKKDDDDNIYPENEDDEDYKIDETFFDTMRELSGYEDEENEEDSDDNESYEEDYSDYQDSDITESEDEEDEPEIIFTEPVRKTSERVTKAEKSDKRIKEKKTEPIKRRPYVAPPLYLLSNQESTPPPSDEECYEKARKIEEVLCSFNIDAKVVNFIKGTRLTRFEVSIPSGILLNSLSSYANNIKAAVESCDDIVMYLPLPGTRNIGIDISNKKQPMIAFKEMVEDPTFRNSTKDDLFVIGKKLTGENVYMCLRDMPHMMVAGATNSGKSVFLNSIIISLVMHATPEELRLILIDPKFVEFTFYNELPHMLLKDSISEFDQVLNVMRYVVEEMNRRYKLIGKARCKKYDEYMQCDAVKKGESEKFPRLLVVIDEIGDLMSQEGKKDLERLILILVQKARAAGIYLIIATQRPTTQIISGDIKVNISTRVAFKVSGNADSRVILDSVGAENLLGKGDMLYKTDTQSNLERLQAPYISSEDIEKTVKYIIDNNDCIFNEVLIEKLVNTNNNNGLGINESDFDFESRIDRQLVAKILLLGMQKGTVSVSYVQEKLRIGYGKASAHINYLEENNYISKPLKEYNGKRTVLISEEEFESEFGEFNFNILRK